MAKRKILAVHPGEILKTEFREPMGVKPIRSQKRLTFLGSMTLCGEIGPSVPIPPFAWENILLSQPSSG
jgi:hypothetical protein